MDMLKMYGEDIKSRQSTPKDSAQAFVMEEIKGYVKEFTSQHPNVNEKKFILALARLHNNIGKKFSGDWMPIEIE
tara:strand:- start:174 stop:398 length:225 start_codon:yes stop_codon:yes gene_type:complete